MRVFTVSSEILEDIPNKSQTSRKFNFITSRLLDNFPRLSWIPGKIWFFPETALLRVDTPPLNIMLFVSWEVHVGQSCLLALSLAWCQQMTF